MVKLQKKKIENTEKMVTEKGLLINVLKHSSVKYLFLSE